MDATREETSLMQLEIKLNESCLSRGPSYIVIIVID